MYILGLVCTVYCQPVNKSDLVCTVYSCNLTKVRLISPSSILETGKSPKWIIPKFWNRFKPVILRLYLLVLFLPEEAEEFPLLVISQLKRFAVKFQFSIFNFQFEFEFGLKLEISQTLPSCIFKQSHSAWDETYLLKKKKKVIWILQTNWVSGFKWKRSISHEKTFWYFSFVL